MTIEEELFKHTTPDATKLKAYGFIYADKKYQYSQKIMNNQFRVDIEITQDGIIKGYVFDLAFNAEYTNFRLTANLNAFAEQVKDAFIALLTDIKEHCFIKQEFKMAQANRLSSLIYKQYGDSPEFAWPKFPGYALFRQQDTQKWYGIIMNVAKNKLDSKARGEVEIINIKLAPKEITNLLKLKGFYPAYHMNKQNWLSIILDDTLTDQEIMDLLAKSYQFSLAKK